MHHYNSVKNHWVYNGNVSHPHSAGASSLYQNLGSARHWRRSHLQTSWCPCLCSSSARPGASAAPPSSGRSSWSADYCPSSFDRQSGGPTWSLSWIRRCRSRTLLKLGVLRSAWRFPASRNLLFKNHQESRLRSSDLALSQIYLILNVWLFRRCLHLLDLYC